MYPQLQIWRPLVTTSALVAATVFATSTVTVASGDTLSEIAEHHDASVAQLLEWNDLDNPDHILAGATLIVSAPDDASRAATGTGVHVVTAGDTLSAIAVRFSTSVRALVAANTLADADRIYIGQSLALDGATAETTPTTTTTAPVTHTVKAGDTLSTIAAHYGVKTGVLAADNGISDPDRITIGMVLTIGAPAPSAETPATTTTTVPSAATPTTTTAPSPAPTTTVPSTTVPTTATVRPADEVLLVPMFARWAEAYRVPQDLIEAIAWKESNWAPAVVGSGGHLGIMQLSPATVDLIEGGLLGKNMDELNASDGIQMGARYLRYLLDRTDSERAAVAAWRQGLHSVQTEGISDSGAAYADSIEEIRLQRS